MLLTYLPNEIKDKGIVFKRLGQVLSFSGAIKDVKAMGLRYRTVSVLSRNLRRRNDLYGRPYQPTEWLFIEKKGE